MAAMNFVNVGTDFGLYLGTDFGFLIGVFECFVGSLVVSENALIVS